MSLITKNAETQTVVQCTENELHSEHHKNNKEPTASRLNATESESRRTSRL